MPPTVTYCVVPPDTEPAVMEVLRQKYADDDTVSVIVDERQGEGPQSPEIMRQRRPVLRRAIPALDLPGARLEQQMPPVDLTLADQPLALIVVRAAEHDPAAMTELRWRIHSAVSF